ncbi:hypothetical protein CU254_41580 (plasmid) [Amycolatopsis sp. AA4]|uniref:hypothetical protein n=1 Tax=Actinomycetes TaxID=1760 RepID=UPI0001B5518C|nr:MULTISPECIES: hypothetical protein [Actinomycetes]ATY17076.1 hypothetical protein CU254_41580 [Amycolatopsis sp. AA4]EFL12425.1 predicted protein [Streptomyces sp. AA4]
MASEEPLLDVETYSLLLLSWETTYDFSGWIARAVALAAQELGGFEVLLSTWVTDDASLEFDVGWQRDFIYQLLFPADQPKRIAPSTQLGGDLALCGLRHPDWVDMVVREQADAELTSNLARIFVRAFWEVLDWPDWFVGILATVAVKIGVDEFNPPGVGSTWSPTR